MIAGLCCLACAALCWASLDEEAPRVLSLRELAGSGAVLMSCAEDTGRADEPLWCADPDSPHCIPALPEAPARDVWHGPVAALTPLATHPRANVGVLLAWPAIRSASLVSLKLAQRLERPPKRA
jgi:hypothetical protein